MHSEYIYRASDVSDTAVLMIHGILGTPRHFDDFIPLLPESWSVYNVLLDGHGGKVRDFTRTSLKKWRSQVDCVLAELSESYKNIVVMGHSMGTLLAIDAWEKYKDKIKAMILLASATRIRVKPYVAVTSLKVAFDKIDPENEHVVASRKSYSIESDKRLWRYVGWIPRFLELFRISRTARKKIGTITAPTYVYQSKLDELVSPRSIKCFMGNPHIKASMLESSYHYLYENGDMEFLKSEISSIFNALEADFA